MSNRKSSSVDYWLLIITLILVVGGILLVFDSSFARAADRRSGDSWYFVKLQIGYALAGFIALYAAASCHPKTIRFFSKIALYVSLALLALVLVPGIGKSIAGSSRWIQIGPFHLQPSEMAKIAIVMYLADVLASQGLRIRRPKNLLTALAPVAVVLMLVVVEDLGTTGVAVLTGAIMLFAAGAKKRHLFGTGAVCALGATVMVMIEPYRLARILSFLNPLATYDGGGYQISHALFALAAGGIRGIGLCEGREKFFIPAPQTDMIVATLAEEAGLIGMLALLGLFIWFISRGLTIAKDARSPYMNLLALGVTAVIAVQALINIAVVTASIPATGVPLPFISYGGSHLIMMLFGVGMVLSVSRHLDEQMPEPEQGEYESRRHGRGNGRSYISCTEYRPPTKRTRSRSAVRR